MNIQEAFERTKTRNKKQLAEFLGFKRPSAVYQWDENKIPETSEFRILKMTGYYQDVQDEKPQQATA